MNKKPAADKTLSLNLRRVRATVRTQVNTGGVASIRKQQGTGCGYSVGTG